MGAALSLLCCCGRRPPRGRLGWHQLRDRARVFDSALSGVAAAPLSPHASGADDKPAITPAGNPLPRVLHQRLAAGGGLRAEGRVIIVGDLHGCAAELHALLEEVGFRCGVDNLICTGDLVTKGPESDAAVCAVRALGAAVRGNNDDAALAAYTAWQQRGEPPLPKFEFVKSLSADAVEFLAAAPFTISLPDYGLIVAHGGIVPGVPLHAQDLWAVTTMRVLFQEPNHAWRAYEGEKLLTPIGARPWAECWPGPAHVVFGHDSKRLLQRAPCATGIDTACASGGALTAVVLPPISVLRRSKAFVKKLRRGAPLALEDLQGQIVAVPSQQPVPPPPVAAAG